MTVKYQLLFIYYFYIIFCRKWISDAYNYYEEISRSREGADAGVTNISGYMFSNISPENVKVFS